MTTLIFPQSNPIDPNGRFAREWVLFFQQVAAAAAAATGTVTNAAALTAGQLVIGGGGNAISTFAAGTNAYVVTMVGGVPAWAPAASTSKYVKGAAWDSGGSLSASPVVATAASVVLGVAQSAGTIQSCTMVAEGGPGSCTVEVWKTAAGSIPTSANKISASAPGTLSAASYSLDSTLTGWSKTVTAGDVFAFKLLTASTLTWISIVLTIG